MTYTYSIQNDFPNHKISSDRLAQEIQQSAIVVALNCINTAGDVCDILFKAELSEGNKTILDGLVAAHSGEPLPENEVKDVNIKTSAIVVPNYEKGFQDLTGHNFYKKGLHGTAAHGETTDFYISFSANMYLPGGGYRIGSTATTNDYIGVQIVDKDNILGYGAGLVLGTFIDADYCWPNKEWEVLTGDAKMIPAGIYLRMRYVSTGPDDVDVIGWYSMRT
jgi:hypothetical protein